ncbi:unnamed protein product [Spirodela intermedia]|uniref:Uncharacterized protein n=1 Tax=Spirodela intermedia TaxID=51605 RepID=A0A7I8IWW2_SPIIN|nr:unnamed protein product [Spirodela intermedia]CAA6662350.1 unnamed protein product [Spirodela intermedia]
MRKRKRKAIVLDEAARLQRRTRYLLVRMKLEQNLIDAYSAEGWKGQSREKIRPENELQRARKQILNCKVGIRDAIHQLELQSSEGCIEDSVMHPDGSVHHEHIFCAKCKSREAFSDNDIILCDGTCNRAFHQKCLEPPLEKIPPGDQGWLCKFCECKMEILEAVNAHLGTSFSVNSRWEDIFEEAAGSHDGENAYLDPSQDWPSEDSEDDDYNPEINEKNNSLMGNDDNKRDDDACSSSDSCCCSDEASFEFQRPVNDGKDARELSFYAFILEESFHLSMARLDSDDAGDRDAMNFRRQRRDVDYRKLYDEMFGKDQHENEQSEDEDWGPRSRRQRRRRRLESNDGTDNGSCGDADQEPEKQFNTDIQISPPCISQERKCLFRIPREAVEKLRQVFAQNELPSKAIKEDLSRELGLSSEKVSKWFKNARYAALKIRKNGSHLLASSKSLREDLQTTSPKSASPISEKKHENASLTLPADPTKLPRIALSSPYQANYSAAPDDPMNQSEETAGAEDDKSPFLDEMERLCSLCEKITRLKVALRASCEPSSSGPVVVYIPVAELREKV